MVGPQAALIVATLAVLASSCDGRLVVAGNVVMAVIPCVLLWITVNLKKTR